MIAISNTLVRLTIVANITSIPACALLVGPHATVGATHPWHFSPSLQLETVRHKIIFVAYLTYFFGTSVLATYSDFFTSTNGVKQGGILSPLFFNVYMDNLSAQLNSRHIGCSTGDVVVNHMLYADDIALFSPSAKGLQKLLDMCFTYGCSHDIQFNPLKSVVMYIDSRKLGAARPMVIGSDQLNFVSYYTYLGHIICDDLSDESDMKAKARQMYARSNMLRQRFHFCSADVKNKLFSTFFNNIYMCALWVKCTKSTFHMFIVSYNNCYRILHRLPMRCSASGMFAAANVNSGSAVFRKCIYSLMTRINRSSNDIICNVANGDVYLLSTLRRRWLIQLYNF